MAQARHPEIAAKPNPEEFRRALSRLATDAEYREKATKHPEIILDDFKLSLRDLQALRQVAVLSGADVRAVNRVRAREIARFSEEPGLQPDALTIDISCCSCCCCCCGETAVLSVAAAGR